MRARGSVYDNREIAYVHGVYHSEANRTRLGAHRSANFGYHRIGSLRGVCRTSSTDESRIGEGV